MQAHPKQARRRQFFFVQPRSAGNIPAITSINRPSSTFCDHEIVLKRLSFLNPIRKKIHSIILVGSTAYGTRKLSSDIDIVIVAKEADQEEVREFIYGWEIEASMNSGEKDAYEFTILSASETEELFQQSSPFAFSIIYGLQLRDDGFLAQLCGSHSLDQPSREYFVKSLSENITTQYFSVLKGLEQEAKMRQCSGSCCRINSECKGLSPAGMLPKLIMRMLYITLPARGIMPLTKNDAILFVESTYGKDCAEVTKIAADMMRNKTNTIHYHELCKLKLLAAQLFKEILRIVGRQKDVMSIIMDAASAVCNDHRQQGRVKH